MALDRATIPEELSNQIETGKCLLFVGVSVGAGLPNQDALLEIPCSAIHTTNHDKLIESAFASHQGRVLSVYMPQNIPATANLPGEGELYLLKVRDDVDRPETAELGRRDRHRILCDNGPFKCCFTSLWQSPISDLDVFGSHLSKSRVTPAPHNGIAIVPSSGMFLVHRLAAGSGRWRWANGTIACGPSTICLVYATTTTCHRSCRKP